MEVRFKFCPNCQTCNLEEAKRCMECGNDLEDRPVTIILDADAEAKVIKTEAPAQKPLRRIETQIIEEVTEDPEIERIATLTATNPENWTREEHGFRYKGGILDIIRVPPGTRVRLGNKVFEPGRRVRANNALLTLNPHEPRQR